MIKISHKISAAFIIAVCFVCLAPSPVNARKTQAQTSTSNATDDMSINADARVAVTIQIEPETYKAVIVRGTDAAEVRVLNVSARESVAVRRGDASRGKEAATRVSVIAQRVDFDADLTGDERLEINVPRAAQVTVNITSGDVSCTQIGAARIIGASGDVRLENIAGDVEAQLISGDVAASNVRGSVRVQLVSGDVRLENVTGVNANDELSAQSVSGDIVMIDVRLAKINAESVSGSIAMSGVLMNAGRYSFTSHSGDVELSLPADVVVRLTARTGAGSFDSAFPVKLSNNATTPSSLRIAGIIGAANNTDDKDVPVLNMTSFSGSLHLRRQ
ncbi:MAG: DUF4097 domain-containing protein [Pyrinomonadaceae bacterium MAG19_C2-C3]|nr:DUF4097 domain-containing protein [Pyrinomonadaceae bacterium MAG19_C2-C3]